MTFLNRTYNECAAEFGTPPTVAIILAVTVNSSNKLRSSTDVTGLSLLTANITADLSSGPVVLLT